MTDNDKNNIDLTVHYIASGTNNTFPYPYSTFEDSDIDVYVNGTLITTGYYYQANDERSAGDVIFVGNPEKDSKITISRTLEFTAVAHFQEAGSFRASVMNVALERLLAYCQQLLGYANRSMRLPPYENKIDLTLPSPLNGHAIVWSKDGTGLVNSKYPADDALDVSIQKAAEATNAAEAAAVSEENAKTSETNAAQSASEAAAIVTGFDTHAAMKQSDFDTNASVKKEDFNNNAIAKTEAYNNNAGQQTEDFNVHALDVVESFDQFAKKKTTDFDQNAQLKQLAVDESASVASKAANAAENSAADAKRFRDEAEEIANLPAASETVSGAAMIATAEEASAGTNDTKMMSPAKVKIVIASHASNKSNPHGVTKAQVGLGSVDNTSDEDKPLSAAARNKLAEKLDVDEYKNLSETTLQSTLVFTGGTIPLKNGITRYYTSVTESTTFSIDETNHVKKNASDDVTFTLVVDMPAAVVINWPEGIWGGNDAPDMSEPGRYLFALTKFHDREAWLGNPEDKFTL